MENAIAYLYNGRKDALADNAGPSFVEYLTRDQAVRARADLASYVVYERPIRVDVMRPIDFVSGLAAGAFD